MQPEPREPVKIGTCGISCTVCRFGIKGQCECRVGEGSRRFGRVIHRPCPVEQCASSRDLTFCARDCPDFPCLLLEHAIPHRWSRLATGSAGAPLPGQETPSAVPLPPAQQLPISQSDDTLYIICLGQFRIFRGNVELKNSDWGHGRGPTQKIKALFAFLVSRRDHGARKETLIDLLWPQQTDLRRANSSFHQALFYLRRALEPNLEPGAFSSYIRRQGERYHFAPQKPCWIDAEAFVACTDRARSLEQSADPASAIACWARAAELYGGRFMAGIDSRYTRSDLYDWCASASYRFEQLFLAATLKVARHHLAEGQHALAIVHLREALLTEPAFESAHLLLIQCLMQTGQWEQALAQYRVCEAGLAFHQDREPSAEVKRLYEELSERIGTG